MNIIPLKTQCVGNLFVDVPTKPRLVWVQSLDGAEVTRMDGVISREQFWKHVEARKAELQAMPHVTEKSQLGLFEVINDHAALALYRDSDVWTGGYSMDRFLWLNTRGYLFKSPATDNDTALQISRHSTLFSKVLERSSGGPPGFCIDGAVVTDSFEDAEVYASQGDLSVVGLRNGSLTIGHSFSSLALPPTAEVPISPFQSLQREQESISASRERFPSGVGAADFTRDFEVLRKRERRVGGTSGEEIAYKEILNDGRTRYRLLWANVAPRETLPRSAVSISLKIGNDDDPADPALDQLVMFALWDAMLESARAQ